MIQQDTIWWEGGGGLLVNRVSNWGQSGQHQTESMEICLPTKFKLDSVGGVTK